MTFTVSGVINGVFKCFLSVIFTVVSLFPFYIFYSVSHSIFCLAYQTCILKDFSICSFSPDFSKSCLFSLSKKNDTKRINWNR